MFTLINQLGANLHVRNNQSLTPLALAAKLANKRVSESCTTIYYPSSILCIWMSKNNQENSEYHRDRKSLRSKDNNKGMRREDEQCVRKKSMDRLAVRLDLWDGKGSLSNLLSHSLTLDFPFDHLIDPCETMAKSEKKVSSSAIGKGTESAMRMKNRVEIRESDRGSRTDWAG